MGSSAGPGSEPTVEVVICEGRPFDGWAVAELFAADPAVVVRGVTADVEGLLGLVAGSSRGLLVLVGSTVLRDGETSLVARLRGAAPEARLVVVGVDEASLRRSVDQLGLDGFLQRDGSVEEALRVAGVRPRS